MHLPGVNPERADLSAQPRRDTAFSTPTKLKSHPDAPYSLFHIPQTSGNGAGRNLKTMPNPDPFFAVADRIAHDFYIKLWRFLYESRINPSTSNSMYWCSDMDTSTSTLAAYALQSLTVLTDEFSGNTQAPDTSPPPGSPDLEKYQNISQNLGLEPEPMVVEVILRLPQRSNIAKGRLGSTSPQIWQPIILESWNLSLACEQDDGLLRRDLIHHLVKMHEEPRYFYWTISIYINRLPTEDFIRQIHGPRTSRPPSLPMGLEIALRLSQGSTNDIEKQFAPYGQL